MALLFFYLSIVLVVTYNFKKSSIGFVSYQAAKVLFLLVYIFLITYFSLIDITFSSWLTHVGWMIAIVWIVDFFVLNKDATIVNLTQFIVGILAMLGFLYLIFIYPMTIANAKYDVVKGIEKKTELPQTDEQHIVSVPLAYAKYKAEKLIGELKNYSYYDLGVYSIQKIDDKLVYVIPIEFSEFSTWRRSGKVVPGYITVDALDENADAKLIKHDMKYLPSSYFGDNLMRKVRQAYPSAILLEASFEPDDSGKPYYAVSYGHYNKFRKVVEVDGIILFDPTTGKMKKYKTKDVPKFVDQVMPSNVATLYNTWYGRYVRGWLNSWWGKKEVKIPTDGGLEGNVSPVFDNKRNMSLFTDFTTLNQNASSLVGYSMVDARTGKYVFYTGEKVNGLINGGSAKNAVNKTFTKDKWYGTQAMLYNIYGQMTWFVPVVDGDGLLRNYALVNGKDPKVLATADTKKKAFENYKRILVSKLNGENVKPGTGITMKTVKGTVISKEVVNKEDDIVTYVRVNEDRYKIYQMAMSKLPFSITLEKGDKIEVKYVDTDETIVEIQELNEEKEIKKEKIALEK